MERKIKALAPDVKHAIQDMVRNPLNNIACRAELACESDSIESLRESLTAIKDEVMELSDDLRRVGL